MGGQYRSGDRGRPAGLQLSRVYGVRIPMEMHRTYPDLAAFIMSEHIRGPLLD